MTGSPYRPIVAPPRSAGARLLALRQSRSGMTVLAQATVVRVLDSYSTGRRRLMLRDSLTGEEFTVTDHPDFVRWLDGGLP